jgi:hypothetical protein
MNTKNITAIVVTGTECANEVDAMVCRRFETAAGWAGAFAAIARDAADYLPGLACNKATIKIYTNDCDVAILHTIEVRGADADPFPSTSWAL